MVDSENSLEPSFPNIQRKDSITSISDDNKAAKSTMSSRHWMRRLTKFGEDSSFSGPLYIRLSKSMFKRVIWGVCVILAVTGFCTITALNIHTLVQEPIGTSITVTRQKSLEFPAITVCSLSNLNTTKLEEIGSNLTGAPHVQLRKERLGTWLKRLGTRLRYTTTSIFYYD